VSFEFKHWYLGSMTRLGVTYIARENSTVLSGITRNMSFKNARKSYVWSILVHTRRVRAMQLHKLWREMEMPDFETLLRQLSEYRCSFN
jgi:hypothetical protein